MGPLSFKPVASWEARLTEGDRTLLVYIRMDAPWTHRVFAVECPTSAVGGPTPLATLFAQHGHAVVAEHAHTLPGAVQQAQAYARRWQQARARGGGLADCACEPVAP